MSPVENVAGYAFPCQHMRRKALILLAAASLLPLAAAAEPVQVNPQDSVIVQPAAADARQQDAARELRKHLALITGPPIDIVEEGVAVPPGTYAFKVGIAPADDPEPVASQESRWVITPTAAYFYGDTEGYGDGAPFAVYSFLEDQLGVHWVEPGDEGIVYQERPDLELRTGAFRWVPKLTFRKIRLGGARSAKKMDPVRQQFRDYADFQPTLAEHNAFAEGVMLWQKRMRMGGSRPGGGHAFSTWWEKYGETHPEYFALNKDGRREPVPLPKADQTTQFVKICASNPHVAERVVMDWLPRKDLNRFVNVGINDGAENFCECEECRKLDVPLEEEKKHAHLTDRYVHLANAVAKEVRKHRSDACATMYSYLTTLEPPRRLRLESNLVVQTVPYVIPLESSITEELLGGWQKAGATMLAFRPNYHVKYLTTTMPLGIEKQMFDVFQIAVKNGCISADYDSLNNNWPVTGISDYVLARAMSDPAKPFSHWENQYYSAFGNAADDARDYFRYWRKSLWDQRLMPNIKTICNKGGAGDFARGLLWSIGDYYTLADFDTTRAMLDAAAARDLRPAERKRLRELSLANEHARLMFKAIAADPMDKSENAEDLLAFRRTYKDELKLRWMGVFAFELANGDLTGLEIAREMKGYLTPWLKTELFWRFRLDPDSQGLKEQWQTRSWEETAGWEQLRTDRFWERQFDFDEVNNLSDETAKVITRYDGIGWYTTQRQIPADWKGRTIFLRFGAVDESCWVYLNGQYAGEHVFQHKNDWKTPFEIRIDPLIDWNAALQRITVRVEDKGGMGGIWRPVWVVSKDPVTVAPDRAAIVTPALEELDGDEKNRLRVHALYEDAAVELQKHLHLVTGVEIPIHEQSESPSNVFLFKIGMTPDSDTAEFADQESRWLVTSDSACFYGDDAAYGMSVHNAVYDFLEHQLGVTWVEPGDSGIVYPRRPQLTLRPVSQRWVPKLMFRKIRQCYRKRKEEVPLPERFVPFPEFFPSLEENNRKTDEDARWQRRMRMGGNRPGGGHAFPTWWDRYGATNPEYFALNKFGKREPVELPKGPKASREFIKMCPSNPGLAEQIVKNWLPKKDRQKYVNAGLNDGVENFCECENCRKLDIRLGDDPGEDLPPGTFVSPEGEYTHLTDRYVYLANAVAREVRKHREDAMVAMYAYLTTLRPPRELRLEPNIVVQVVPYVIPLDREITEEIIGGWYKAGATQIAFRPNYHFKYHPMPLPIGIEKEMFDVFQLAVENGCISADYDSLMGCWNLTGMADYVLARAIADPGKDFTYWEDRYCSAFGNAAEDIREYFGYWRDQVWEGRLKPNLDRLVTAGRHGNFARGLGWSIRHDYIRGYKPEGCDQYYTESDFDHTDRILQNAAARELTPEERRRVEQLVLINRHSRLEHGAMYYRDSKGYTCARDLLAFRTKHRTDMNMAWTGVFYVEDVWGDVCNLELVKQLGKYTLPWIKTPFKWRFEMDAQDAGLKEAWQEKSWDETADWKPIRVNVYWSNTYESPHVELKEQLKEYDGIGWYSFRFQTPTEMKGREVFLYFGGVDDSCRVYVNGALAGDHMEDGDTPFEIRIDQAVDWDAEYQHVMVRVEDLEGPGGVHKPTWIVSR